MGKAYEDTKNFDQSFIHYKEANLLQRKKIDFSLKLEEEEFKEIKNIYNKKLFDKYKNADAQIILQYLLLVCHVLVLR